MLTDLVNEHTPQQIQADNCVRRILVGAGPLTPSLYAACQQLYPMATFVTAYGMTEACSSITFQTLPEIWLPEEALHVQRGVCVGKPPPGIEICIQGDGIHSAEGAPKSNILHNNFAHKLDTTIRSMSKFVLQVRS